MSKPSYYCWSSPFYKHLETNYTPSERELSQIDTFLLAPRDKLLEISTQIQDAQRHLDSLHEQRLVVEEAIRAHEALKSPIRRLPNEVLQEVFLFCLPTHHLPTLDIKEAPLVLTRVCRSWRALAQRMTALWTRVRIVVPKGKKEHREFQAGRIERWLASTKSAPLTVSLFCSADSFGFVGWSEALPEVFDAFAEVIHRHAFHIHTLILNVSDRCLKALLDHSCSDPSAWPLLHKVTIEGGMYLGVGDGVLNPPFLPLWRAPTLKYIAWNTVTDDILDLQTNWGQLEGLEVWAEEHPEYIDEDEDGSGPFCEFSAGDARRIIYAAPSLRRLRIRIARHDDLTELAPGQLPVEGIPKTLVLQHLTKLDLHDVYLDPDTKPTIFLENLQLPALEHLVYDLYNHNFDNLESSAPYPPTSNPFLLRFLQSQQQPVGIKKLTISSTAISREGFMECLKLMPQLEQLWVKAGTELYSPNDYDETGSDEVTEEEKLERWIQPDDDLFEALTVQNEVGQEEMIRPILCPKLHSIRLDKSICSFEAVKAFVESRKDDPRCEPARRLYVHFSVTRPTFVPRQARRLATCPLEEELWDMGVDLTARMWNQAGSYHRWKRNFGRQRYNPKEGLALPASTHLSVWELDED